MRFALIFSFGAWQQAQCDTVTVTTNLGEAQLGGPRRLIEQVKQQLVALQRLVSPQLLKHMLHEQRHLSQHAQQTYLILALSAMIQTTIQC